MNMGLGLFAIFLLGLWLLILIIFGLSFVRHKYVSTASFVIFTIISAFFGYAVAHETRLYLPVNRVSTEGIVLAVVPVICCMMSIVSCFLWFCCKKRIARALGIISVLAAICVYMQI